jgi:protein SCO1
MEGVLAKVAAIAGFAAMLAITVGFAGYVYWPRPDDPLNACRGGAIAGDIGGPFTLIDTAGRTVTERDIITKPTLIYFGYTYCPDICPFDNARNAQAIDILEERGIDAQPVFISVDPERDTPQVMAEYSANMHPAMIGLTGDATQIKSAADAFRVLYQRRDVEGGDYLMDHSVFTYLMMPESGFADFFQRSATPEQVADAVACFAGA